MTAVRTAAETIAGAYETIGAALELGSVVIDGSVFSDARVRVPLATLNRHGLVTGATGTGKTKTLQQMAEQLSDAGVPVVLVDQKGDLQGLSSPGADSPAARRRAVDTGMEWDPRAYPVEYYSAGTDGMGQPVQATVESFGPVLLARVLGLNHTQESCLTLVFRWAQDNRMPLSTLADLADNLTFLRRNKELLLNIGGLSGASVDVMLRAIHNFDFRGGGTLFGDEVFDHLDLMQVDDEGRGVVSIFEVGDRGGSIQRTSFPVVLVWLLRSFMSLPEIGDVDKPKLVFIIDEAHLLFQKATAEFMGLVEDVVRLIRSKGGALIFSSQMSDDIPDPIRAQLGMRVQHGVRASTPKEVAALKRTAETFPRSSVYDIPQSMMALPTGEALVTVLSETGMPTAVAWVRLRPPRSLMGAIGDDAVRAHVHAADLKRRRAPEPVARSHEFHGGSYWGRSATRARPEVDEDAPVVSLFDTSRLEGFLAGSAAQLPGRAVMRGLGLRSTRRQRRR